MMNIFLSCLILFGQTFGQNKVQYKDLNFKILGTEHFDIYFSRGGEDLAAFAEDVLEDGYTMLAEDLGIETEFRIPVILYKSPNDFSQTNVTLDLIEESVGGFSETLKNRMVIPFNGDYEEFRHVLIHELTHIFQFKIFFPSQLGAALSGDIFYSVPPWVMEGHAEFSSCGWDLEADIFMRDLIMNHNIIHLSELSNYSGYIIYKEGQAFFNYIADKYGIAKIGEFIYRVKANPNLDVVFSELFGLTVDEFQGQWIMYYQMKYFPKIGKQKNFYEFARSVYDHKKTNSLYNTSPVISSNGDKIAFISDREGVAEITIISSIDGEVLKKLVKAEYSSGYEGLHLYQGGLSWSPDDIYLAFAAKSKGKDVLYIFDAQHNKLHKKIALDLDGIYSPRFSSSGEKIVFSGLKDGRSDIYILEIESGTVLQITDDIYTDKYPSFSAWDEIAFVSDRPDSGEEYTFGSYAVFLNLSDNILRVTPRTGYVASPCFDPTGGLFFVADYDSVCNLYWCSNDTMKSLKRTDILTGIYYPTISKDGSKIAFSYYNNYGYDICVTKDPLMKMEECETPGDKFGYFVYEKTEVDSETVTKYTPRFTFDYFSVGASYYSALGFSGLCEVGVSDILGNHYIELAFDLYGNISSSDIFLKYWYIKKRIDYGVGLFQQLNYFSEDYDLYVWRYLGGAGIVQYPFDRFVRAEFGVYAFKIYETRWLDYFPWYYSTNYIDSIYNFLYPSLAFVWDNANWGSTGPESGRRARIEGYATVLSDFEIRSCVLDYRRYYKLSPRASFAIRLAGAVSVGPDVEHWSIGGPYSLRGYDSYAFSGSKVGFANFEYRFPFVDNLGFSFPFPIQFRNIRGVLFADFGGVYNDAFEVYSTVGGFHLEDIKMGFGAGLRVNFLSMIWQLDIARAHNLQEFTDDWKFHLTIGSEW